MIEFATVKSDAEILQILEIQSRNLPQRISETELKEQGFLTLQHDFDLLKRMTHPYPHIIAKSEDQVVGYALVMLSIFQNEFPILQSMFEQINQIIFRGEYLKDSRYFVMGQICIAKEFRSRGIFHGLYKEMKERMLGDFDYVITEVSKRNPRSMKAHLKVGFQNIKEFSADGEDWVILLLDLKT